MTEQRDRDAVYDKPIAYEEGERVVYRASSLGMCLGALVRARLGVSGSAPSDMMQERFDEGHDWEERVLLAGLGVDYTRVVDRDHLAMYGTVVEDVAGLQVETAVEWGNKVVRCHPDAIAIQGSTLQPHVVEVKFLGEQMFAEAKRDFDAFLTNHPTYRWQAAVEMLSTGLPLLYIVGQKVVREREGVDREVELGEVLTVEYGALGVGLPGLKDVKARVLEVEGYVARGEMPACPVPFMYPCPYWADHEATDKVVIDNEALAAWVDVWREADKAVKKAAEDMEFAKKALAEQMAELGYTSGRCDGVDIAVVGEAEKGNVSWAKAYKALSQQTGERVDEDKFRGAPSKGYVRVQEAKDVKE